MERTHTTAPGYYARGSFSAAQKAQLIRGIRPERVMHLDGNSHLSQQDVRAHLIRTFDFGGFDIEILEIALVFEQQYDKPGTNGKPDRKGVWDACYRSVIRLTLRNPDLAVVQILEDGSTATAQAQSTRGAAHDLAYKSAISLGIKRAATSLGDQFGLSLYNKGQVNPLVRNTIAQLEALRIEMGDNSERNDLQDGIEQQVSLGLDGDGALGDYDDDQSEQEPPAPSAKPPATKRATNGRQGTKRAAAPKDAPAVLSEAPAATEAPATTEAPAAEEAAPKVDLNRARAADALPGETEPEYQNRKRAERDAAEVMEREQRAAEAAEQEARARAAAEDQERQEASGREAAAAEDEVARIKAEREARGAPTRKTPEEAAAIVKAEPEPWAEPAAEARNWGAMTPGEWQDYVPTIATVEGVKEAWQGAEAAGVMVTELRMLLLKRKARLEAPVPDPTDQGAQLVGAEG